MCALVGADVASEVLCSDPISVLVPHGKLDDRDTDAVALLLDGIDLVQLLLVVPVLVGRSEDGDALHIACFTVESEDQQLLDWDIQPRDIGRLEFWLKEHPWKQHTGTKKINELRITRDAYPKSTLAAMGKFLSAFEGENARVQDVLTFALLCVLESLSFTRKDGQYLRWDHRSGRRQGKKAFDKGQILSFEKAIHDKLQQIVDDLQSADMPQDLFGGVRTRTEISLHTGSCLEVLPRLKEDSFDCIITSPPYCNRYDYTRTYALELALLGVDEAALIRFRQEMLSCTVENRAKDLLALNRKWEAPITVCNEHKLLQAILAYLEDQKKQELLNNSGIPRMVRGYFYEMACVIAECARVLRRGTPLIMVNDNVRYAGASVSVDIILSEIAERLGFETDQILVLPNGKGNSSQQW